jgi:hypothetical protein
MIALYPYAANSGTGPNDPSQYDWSMKYLLPEMFNELQAHGWDSSAEPLIGMPQAFGYSSFVAPTRAELATQMTGYCNAGAVSLLLYSWNDGYPSTFPDASSTEPVNNSEMRAGIAEGLRQCQTYWSGT